GGLGQGARRLAGPGHAEHVLELPRSDLREADEHPVVGPVVVGQVERAGIGLEERLAGVAVDADDERPAVLPEPREELAPHAIAGGPVGRPLDRFREPQGHPTRRLDRHAPPRRADGSALPGGHGVPGGGVTRTTEPLSRPGASSRSGGSCVDWLAVTRAVSGDGVVKPAMSVRTWYCPAGTAGNRNEPSGPVTTVSTTLPESVWIVTVTPGTPCPARSTAMPATVPVGAGDFEAQARARPQARAARRARFVFVMRSVSIAGSLCEARRRPQYRGRSRRPARPGTDRREARGADRAPGRDAGAGGEPPGRPRSSRAGRPWPRGWRRRSSRTSSAPRRIRDAGGRGARSSRARGRGRGPRREAPSPHRALR